MLAELCSSIFIAQQKRNGPNVTNGAQRLASARRFTPPPPAAAQTEDEYFVDELLDAMGCLPFSKAPLAKPSF